MLSCRVFSKLLSILVVIGLAACTTGRVGERIEGELQLAPDRGEVVALLKNPTEVGTLTSGYGYRRHPITGLNRPHLGIDLAAPTGTPVLAAADGVLLFQGDQGTFGNLSKIKHGKHVVTAYAHLDRFELGLVPGNHVRKGQVIGYVGTSGRSSGPHLHYEVLMRGEQINPLGLSGTEVAEDVGTGLRKVADDFGSVIQQVGSALNEGLAQGGDRDEPVQSLSD